MRRQCARRSKGSPPRRRGKVRLFICFHLFAGITPAQAGKSRHVRQQLETIEDHPRAGGEKSAHRIKPDAAQGSPPRRRGKVGPHTARKVAAGITPAQAGKSRHVRQQLETIEDHPRAGGEKDYWGGVAAGVRGSPPRRRGKDWLCNESAPLSGITPAQAGKRFCKEIAPPSVEDHPRAGGEKTWTHCKPSMTLGSPPRRRGKELPFVGFQPHTGITPAQAGKSCGRASPRAQKGDHPRAGGEKAAGGVFHS